MISQIARSVPVPRRSDLPSNSDNCDGEYHEDPHEMAVDICVGASVGAASFGILGVLGFGLEGGVIGALIGGALGSLVGANIYSGGGEVG